MSDETALIYSRARRSGVSSTEAWEDLKALAEEIDWDPEQMVSDSDTGSDTVSDRELPQ